MKILVTGADGYLGEGIVRALCDLGAAVTAADETALHTDPRAERVTGDVFAAEEPFRRFGEPDALLHLAWKDGFDHFSPAHLALLPRHADFLRRMMDGGLRRVAVMGSMHECGRREGLITGDTPCEPMSDYGIAKNALRQWLRVAAERRGVQWQWLRAFYIVGNQSRGCSVFSKIAAAEAAGQARFPFTGGARRFDFLDYEAFCRQAAAAVLQERETGVIHLCSGRAEPIGERVERFIRENGYRIRLQYGAFPDRPYDAEAVWGDAAKIRRIMEGL